MLMFSGKKNLRLNFTLCCIPCVVAKATSQLYEEFRCVRNADRVLLVKLPKENEISFKPKFTLVILVLQQGKKLK